MSSEPITNVTDRNAQPVQRGYRLRAGDPGWKRKKTGTASGRGTADPVIAAGEEPRATDPGRAAASGTQMSTAALPAHRAQQERT